MDRAGSDFLGVCKQVKEAGKQAVVTSCNQDGRKLQRCCGPVNNRGIIWNETDRNDYEVVPILKIWWRRQRNTERNFLNLCEFSETY
jgi:elongation factor G